MLLGGVGEIFLFHASVFSFYFDHLICSAGAASERALLNVFAKDGLSGRAILDSSQRLKVSMRHTHQAKLGNKKIKKLF